MRGKKEGKNIQYPPTEATALSHLNVILNNRNRFCGFMLHLPFDKRQPDIPGRRSEGGGSGSGVVLVLVLVLVLVELA